jgi:hypothetical protein
MATNPNAVLERLFQVILDPVNEELASTMLAAQFGEPPDLSKVKAPTLLPVLPTQQQTPGLDPMSMMRFAQQQQFKPDFESAQRKSDIFFPPGGGTGTNT